MSWYKRLSPLQKTVFYFSLFVALGALFWPPPAQADDCLRDPLNAADCMRTPGYRETITVIFSALPALSVVVPNLLGGSTQTPTTTQPPSDGKPPEKEQPPEQVVNYVVQASAQSLTLRPKQPQALNLKAWKSVNGAPWVPAPEVQLGVSVSPGGADLTVEPRAGMGEMQVILTPAEDVQPGQRTLTVRGVARNSQTSATIQLIIEATPYELRTSANRIEISVGESVELEVSCWKQNKQGLMEEEPNARIRPWLPTEKDFFEWYPPGPYTRGKTELYGRVVMRITAVKARKEEELCFLDFTAIFPDKTELNKRVEIVLKMAKYEIEFV